MKLRLSALERLFVILSLFLLSGALLPLWRQMSGYGLDFVEGDPLQQVIFAAIYAISFILLLLSPHRISATLRAGVYLWLLLGWTLLSTLWSEFPEITIRRVIALFGTTIFGIYLASRFETRECLRLLGWTLLIAVVLSYIFILFLPEWGIMLDTRGVAWRGVYVHKNGLGRMSVLAAVVFYLLAKSETHRRRLWWSSLILSIGLLLGSYSATALVVLFALLLSVPVIKISRLRYNLSISIFLIVVILGSTLLWFISTNIEQLLGILGRDVTLTGRTYLWKMVIYMASQRPWLGYGYGAFWLGWNGPSALVWQRISFPASHAHNSFLDLWLALGYIGIALFVLSYLIAFKRTFELIRKTKGYIALWPIIYLLFMLLYSISESSILQRNNDLWVLYVAVILKV